MGDAWHRIGNVVGSEVTPPGRNRTCNSVLDQPLRPSTEADAMANRERNVLVNAYVRVRNGRLEHVCKHYRSLPNS